MSAPAGVDRTLPVPLYHQLERVLRDAIDAGVHRSGELLPSESEICERYDVSRSVVRQTLANLAHAGIVQTERGRGSFVAETKLHERFVQRATGFYDDLTRMGLDIQTEVLRQETVELPLEVREFLETPTGIRIDRLRSVDGRVLAFVTTYVSPARCPGLESQDLTNRSLYDHLDRTYGLRVYSGRRNVEAVAASDDVARHLDVAPGTPLLLLRSASRTADGVPFEWFEAWHRADRTMFEVEIVPGETVRPFQGVVRRAVDGHGVRRNGDTGGGWDSGSEVAKVLAADRVVAVLRAPRYGDPRALAEGLVRGGIRLVEFTLTGENAIDAVRQSAAVAGAIVGVGSVLTPAQARAAVEAGARFLVSPVGALEIVAAADGVPVFLAGSTPTEVWQAWQATGAPVKLYPADRHGPAYLKSLLAPMPNVPVMPSGGVTADNAAEYLAAGAVAVNVGGALCPPDVLVAGDGTELTPRARALCAAIAAAP